MPLIQSAAVHPTRRQSLAALAAAGATLAAPGVFAQAFPNRPLRMIVGFTPGGAADVMARIVAKGLGTQLGQNVIVDNKPGADGILASQELIRAAPDGYTLMMGTNTATVAVPDPVAFSLRLPPIRRL